MSSKSGINASKQFHNFLLKRLLLQRFQPASPRNIHQRYSHQGTLRSLIFCLSQNHEHVQNPSLRTNLEDASQPGGPRTQLPSAPPLHCCTSVCPLASSLSSVCLSLPLKLLFAVSIWSPSSRQKSLMPEWSSALSTKNDQEMFLSYDT